MNNIIINKIEDTNKTKKLFEKVKDADVINFLNLLIESFTKQMAKSKAVTNEFKFWLHNDQKCCLYIRPASKKIAIFMAHTKPETIKREALKFKLPTNIEKNTSNPGDQFGAVIVVDKPWLKENSDKAAKLPVLIYEIISNLDKNDLFKKGKSK